MNLYKKVINKLIIKNISISVAESCTGGLLSSKITEFPGVSKIYHTGITVYSNSSKSLFLNIPNNLIAKKGAVSKEIAKILILNLYKRTKSKLCISTTGIAGPNGGTKDKPNGLVYIGIKYKKNTIILKKNYLGTRKEIQKQILKDVFKKLDSLI